MFTLPLLVAIVAISWVAYEAFATWSENLLGIAALGFVLVLLAFVPFAIDEDRRVIADRRDDPNASTRRNR